MGLFWNMGWSNWFRSVWPQKWWAFMGSSGGDNFIPCGYSWVLLSNFKDLRDRLRWQQAGMNKRKKERRVEEINGKQLKTGTAWFARGIPKPFSLSLIWGNVQDEWFSFVRIFMGPTLRKEQKYLENAFKYDSSFFSFDLIAGGSERKIIHIIHEDPERIPLTGSAVMITPYCQLFFLRLLSSQNHGRSFWNLEG